MDLKDYYNILTKDYTGWDDQYKFVIDNLTNKTPFSYARFNDGEMMGIDRAGSVVARGDQYVNEDLQASLIEAIEYKQENYYIGIPCHICFNNYHNLANKLIGDYDYKVSAVALTNRNWAKFMAELPDAIEGNKVRFISGDDQNLTFLKEKLKFEIVDHTKLPSKNSWADLYKLNNYLGGVDDGDVVFISLGPTARVLARKWFEERPNVTFIDIGSVLDPFTRNVWHNCHKGWQNGFNITKRCKSCN